VVRFQAMNRRALQVFKQRDGLNIAADDAKRLLAFDFHVEQCRLKAACAAAWSAAC